MLDQMCPGGVMKSILITNQVSHSASKAVKDTVSYSRTGGVLTTDIKETKSLYESRRAVYRLA